MNNGKLSKNFIDFLIEITEGHFTPEKFENTLSLFESEIQNRYFPKSSEANLIRVLNSVYDKVAFLNDCLNYPHHIEILLVLINNSSYLVDIIVGNPEYLYLLFNPDFLNEKLSVEKLSKEIDDDLNKYKTFDAKVNQLRRIKRKYIIKIGLNDLLHQYDLEEVTRCLSILANLIVNKLFKMCYNNVNNNFKDDFDDRTYALISLGKLGGNELNYSSDLDFILIFDKNTFSEKYDKEYFEIINEATILFIQKASELTARGYLYRIDFRLRPDGRNAPLCRTIQDTINYYESRGAAWEKQMLLKMNFVSGEINLYRIFSQFRNSFLVSSALAKSPFETIKKMKKNIEQRNNSNSNIKLIPGGIRDIEFSVQGLQLITVKDDNDLFDPNTLSTIIKLGEREALTKRELKIFSEAYIFYRKIEHYAQLRNDLQTHSIPEDREEIEKLNQYLGFNKIEAFKSYLSNCTTSVKEIYNSIVGEHENSIENYFTGSSQNEKNKIVASINFLKYGIGVLNQKKFDKRTTELFEKIETKILFELSKHKNPIQSLMNFSKFVSKISLPSIFYRELQSSILLDSFLSLCEKNNFIFEMLSKSPTLNSLILNHRILSKMSDEEFATLNTEQLLFIISCQYTLNLIDEDEFSLLLSESISAQIRRCVDDKKYEYKYFISGLGSFGVQKMMMSSDVDLVVAADCGKSSEFVQNDFTLQTHELNNSLSPFSIDYKLRAEGKSSQLVWDFASYNKYIRNRARVWELQAITKIRFICGDEVSYQKFLQNFIIKIKTETPDSIKKEIWGMHQKLTSTKITGLKNTFDYKYSKGALVTIDFLIEFALLTEIITSDTTVKNYNSKEFATKLSAKIFKDENFIADASRLYRKIILLSQLFYCTKSTSLSEAKLKTIEEINPSILKDAFSLTKDYARKINLKFIELVKPNSK